MRTLRRLLLAALLAACALPLPAQAQSSSPEDSSSVQTSSETPPGFEKAWSGLTDDFHEQMETGGHVGGTLWLAHGGEVLKKEHHGFAQLDPKRPIDDETIYHWASITKTFTGIAIMQLRDRGLLSLDDPVVNYLPVLREVHNPYGPMEAITIRMLLSHTAGFRSPTWPWGGDEEWHPHEPTEWSQLVAMMPYTKIHFEPGTKVKYSNPGIIFLGQIIEQLSGEAYETYVDKNIFTPLQMNRSYFDNTPQHLLPHRSDNYVVTAEGDTVAGGLDFNTGITVSNGGLNAPASDMLRYASFLTGSCEQEACEEVLTRSSLEEMWEPGSSVIGEAPLSVDGEKQMWERYIGLTFFMLRREGVKVAYHTGGQKAYSALLMFDPEAGVSAVAAFNSKGDSEEAAATPLGLMMQRLPTQVFPLFR